MSRLAFVLGGADSLGPDYAAAVDICGVPDAVFATNHAARDWPAHVDHLVTMHPELAAPWLEARRANGGTGPGCLWCPPSLVKHPGWRRVPSWGGSSGMLAVTAAMEDGFGPIVLCGVPMLPTGKHYDKGKPWDDARRYHQAWERRKQCLAGNVRSMSGWTATLLGRPTSDWIASFRVP